MENYSIVPLDTGQRIRRKRRRQLILEWSRRVLRNRLLLIVVLWMAKAIVQLARLIGSLFDGS